MNTDLEFDVELGALEQRRAMADHIRHLQQGAGLSSAAKEAVAAHERFAFMSLPAAGGRYIPHHVTNDRAWLEDFTNVTDYWAMALGVIVI